MRPPGGPLGVAEQATYDPRYFETLFSVEERHFWFRARNEAISVAIGGIVSGLAPGYRVLEVGCGTGNVLRLLERVCRGGMVVGMDLFGEGLRYARERASCQLVQGDVRTPPFGARFDVIGLFDVLEHLPDDLQVLRALRDLLTPGGALVLTVPAHASLWSYFDEASHHRRRYSAVDLESKLTRTGYRIDYLTYYMGSIFPLVWLGRWLRRAARRDRNGHADGPRRLAEAELRVTPVANEALAWLLNQECRLLRCGWNLPVGASLLAIARNGAGSPQGAV